MIPIEFPVGDLEDRNGLALSGYGLTSDWTKLAIRLAYGPVQSGFERISSPQITRLCDPGNSPLIALQISKPGSCHKRQKPQAPTPQAPTPQAPILNRQTRKFANDKGLNRNTNLT